MELPPTAEPAAREPDPADRARYEADLPMLDPKPGDTWRYRVTMTNFADERSDEPVEVKFERRRVFVGPKPAKGKSYPCFEVGSGDSAVMREFVEIKEDRISLWGQGIRGENDETESPLIFDKPVLFVRAGLGGGESLPVMELSKDPPVRRIIRVIGRETVVVPAGEFADTIRMQMLGVDGALGVRRTYWFAPGVGIVKEEVIRETDKKILVREKEELIAAPERPE
jgi:hypothetical protein